MPTTETGTSAGGLLNSLKETFRLGKRKPPEALAEAPMPAESLRVPPVIPLADESSAASFTSAPEAEQAVPPGPIVTGAPPAQELVLADGLPDWLSAPSAVESIPTPTATPDWLKDGKAAAEELWPSAPAAPLPEPEAPVVEMPAVEAPVAPSVELHASVVPAAEAPVASPAVEAEKSPEQLAIEQLEEALLKAKKTMTGLLENQNFKQEELTEAMAAAAVANGLIPKLPEHYLEVLLASRILGEQHNYTRMDFQESMSAAIKYFMKAQKG